MTIGSLFVGLGLVSEGFRVVVRRVAVGVLVLMALSGLGLTYFRPLIFGSCVW